MNIRKKITLLLLGTSLVPLLMLAVLVVVLIKQQVENQAISRLDVVAERVVNRVGAVVLRGREITNSSASLTSVQQYVLEHRLAVMPVLHESGLAALLKNNSGAYTHLWLVDGQGKLLASGDGQSLEPGTIKRLITEERALGVTNPESNALGLLIPGQVLAEDGVVGFLIAEIPIGDQLAILTKTEELGETGEALLLNRQQGNDQLIQVMNLVRFPQDQKIDTPLLRQSVFHGLSTVHRGELDYRDVRVLAVGRYLPSFDWAVLVKMDESEVLAPLAWMSLSMGAITLLSVVLVFVTSLVAGGYFVSPLIELTKRAKTLLSTRDWKPVSISSHDELGVLAGAINQLMDEIKQSQLTLEARVEERTNELQQKAQELIKLNEFMVGRELKMVELKKQLAEKQKETA